MRNDGLTPKQLEFREKVGTLLGDYAKEIGPEFDGHEEGEQVEFPVPTGWVLVTQWEDLDEDESYLVQVNSGLRCTHRMGLLLQALDMARSE